MKEMIGYAIKSVLYLYTDVYMYRDSHGDVILEGTESHEPKLDYWPFREDGMAIYQPYVISYIRNWLMKNIV